MRPSIRIRPPTKAQISLQPRYDGPVYMKRVMPLRIPATACCAPGASLQRDGSPAIQALNFAPLSTHPRLASERRPSAQLQLAGRKRSIHRTGEQRRQSAADDQPKQEEGGCGIRRRTREPRRSCQRRIPPGRAQTVRPTRRRYDGMNAARVAYAAPGAELRNQEQVSRGTHAPTNADGIVPACLPQKETAQEIADALTQ